ncbi:MAG: hypothetical protein ACI8UR_002070, partial [Natronomonas sp.]|uniref:hypothetical protein n=1 Tax=Natronomonas sp. TaxID=2184060 RepID=UPI003989DC37
PSALAPTARPDAFMNVRHEKSVLSFVVNSWGCARIYPRHLKRESDKTIQMVGAKPTKSAV